MSTTDDDKTTEQAPDSAGNTGPEASETTDTTAAESTETGSESMESEDGSPQGGLDNAGEGNSEPDNSGAEGDTFPRAYVEDLRKESAGYRTQVRELQERLHRVSVEQTGSLADPADLPFDAAHLESPEALQTAIASLLEAKPHLKARRFVGDVGQGNRESANAGVDLLGILRSRA